MNASSDSDGPPSGHADLEPGWLVGSGRFTLIRILGRGGMGVVWLAQDEQLREKVALKFLPPEVQFEATALHQLRRETARTRRLTHPHIVRIHDLFHEPSKEAFISMEWVDGPNLSDLRLHQSHGVFTWEMLAPLLAQLCDALAYAHAEGVIHRDLKPANLMLDTRGRLKLTDFGLAGMLNESFSRTSARGAGAGTLGFMSPQQLDGAPPAVSDDIYALGAALYDLLTGRPPFHSGDVAHQIRHVAPRPLREQLGGLPGDMPAPAALLVMACLSKDPAERPSSAQAVREWAGRCSSLPAADADLPDDGRPLARREVPVAQIQQAWPEEAPPEPSAPPPAEPPPKFPTTAAAPSSPPHPARSTKFAVALLLVGLLAGIGLVALIGGGIWLFSRTRPTPENARSQPVLVPPVRTNPPAQPTSRPVTNPVPLAPVNALAPAAGPGYITLSLGIGLEGWNGDKLSWTALNSELRGSLPPGPSNHAARLVSSFALPTDFELRFEVRHESGLASLFYRGATLPGDDFSGLQFRIAPRPAGGLTARGSAQGFYNFGQAQRTGTGRNADAWAAPDGTTFENGAWNEVAILARGNHVLHQINGAFVVNQQHDHLRRSSGQLVLELQAQALSNAEPARIAFRNIRYRAWPASEAFPPVTARTGNDFRLMLTGGALMGWKTFGTGWAPHQGGVISSYAVPAGTRSAYLVWQEAAPTDFDLRFRFRRGPGHAAVVYLARDLPDADGRWRGYAYLITPEKLGSIAEHISSRDERILDPGPSVSVSESRALHDGRIVVQGGRITHYVDGRQVASGDLIQPQLARTVIALRTGGVPGSTTSYATFENIQIRPLTPALRPLR